MKKDDFRQLFRDYFSFTGSERNGMILLCAILVIAILINRFIDLLDYKEPAGQEGFLALISELDQQDQLENTAGNRLFEFDPNTVTETALDTLDIPSQIKINLSRYRQKGGLFREPEDFRKLYGMNDSLFTQLKPFIRIERKSRVSEWGKGRNVKRDLFEFDPNSVSGEQLMKLGFTAFQTKNLLAYRSRGGRFRQKSDVLKVFGMDSLLYRDIFDWIVIYQPPGIIPEEQKHVIELNVADSAELITLPGIGPVFAGRIIRYRLVLGGFSSIEQLGEVFGMTPEKCRNLNNLVKVDQSLITPIRLNFTDYRSLNRHPYINGKQAASIIDWRSAHGAFTKKEELLESGLFDEITFSKLEPYLTCQ